VASYTYSKSIDDTSAFLGTISDKNFPQNSHDYRAERALSSFDMRQRFTAAYSYSLPGHALWNRNFELRGIATAQSGQPMTPILLGDNSNTGNTGGIFGSDRPNLVGDPHLSQPTVQEWFNTAAFAVAPPYQFGNAGRNILTGPGLVTFDLALSRRFRVREGMSMQFDLEGFNLSIAPISICRSSTWMIRPRLAVSFRRKRPGRSNSRCGPVGSLARFSQNCSGLRPSIQLMLCN
jgi:hypothetical protein